MPKLTKQLPVTSTSDPARSKLVEAARSAWISRLIDLSRRNNLLFYRPVPTSSVHIPGNNLGLSELLSGKAIGVDVLLPETDKRPGRVLAIARKAQENSEEKGLQTLYVALGFASWQAEDGGRDAMAPVFLFPLQAKRKGRDASAIEIQIVGEPKVNPVLLHVMAGQFDLHMEEDELLEAASLKEVEVGSATDASGARLLEGCIRALVTIEAKAQRLPAFRTEFSAAISNFSFAKLALVNDLEAAGEALSSNEVVAAIAGDNNVRGRLGSAQVAIDPRTLDSKSAHEEFCVLEADSSQQSAVAGIAAGQNAVIHGPPGTGKSQTITNLIATLVANGNTILFVAEKRAALEVVQQRLENSGLGHLAIDLHGAELSSRKVMERVTRTLNLVRNSKPAEANTVHQQFEDRRSKLNAHDARMHAVSERAGKTVFEIQGALLRLPEGARTSVRWRGPELAQLTPERAGKISDLLREAVPYASLFLRREASPWTQVAFGSAREVQNAVDLSQRLVHETLPNLASQLHDLSRTTSFRTPESFTQADTTIAVLTRIREVLEKYSDEVFAADLPGLLRDLSEAKGGGLKAFWLSWISAPVKAARKRLAELRKEGKVGLAEGYAELSMIEAVRHQWRELTKDASIPTSYPALSALEKAVLLAKREVNDIEQLTGKQGFAQMHLQELAVTIQPYAGDAITPYRILSVSELERRLRDLGVQRLLEDLRQRDVPTQLWTATFDHAWLTSAFEDIAIRKPEVRSFMGATHGKYVEEFKQLDTDRLRLAKDRVRRIHAERTIAAMNAHPDQEALIKQEAARTRRFMPLRKVFQEARDVMTAVCPCWMASPLSVAQLIHSDVKFDYVIFDEASQILPEDAIPAVMRGRYVVVAGDNKQLPPTGFFAADNSDGDDADETAAIGYESLLDMMLPFAHAFHLNWHYRSRDEALIAFSNHWMYDNRLVTFPGIGGPSSVTHVLVDRLPESDGQEDSAGAEVERVVEMVLKHAAEHPDKSLGVITMGIKHADRVQGALDRAQGKCPELADFFDPGRPDRFFIKNLERVQGDERDCIILSVGYAKDRAGNLPLRFGPILAAGGMRRLNVAVTRARERMTVVSSFAHTDIDLTKVRPGTGLEFLRNYLQYAASNGTLLAHRELSSEPMNDFEADIYEALAARGLKLVPQVGCSQFRIDFGVCHPSQPGRFVLAVEADGATYHSSYTARDRDRLRQQMLENLGWSFHRIWSTDWFQRKSEEIDRAVAAYERAVAHADEARLQQTIAPALELVPELPLEELSAQRSSIFPPIPKRGNIGEYTSGELQALYGWVASDGRLRTNDEMADEMFKALPFARRGSKIEATLRETIRRCEKANRR